MCLTIKGYLMHKVKSMVSLNKLMISGHLSIHEHCHSKGIKNTMANLPYIDYYLIVRME